MSIHVDLAADFLAISESAYPAIWAAHRERICAVMGGFECSGQSIWASADYVAGWIGWLAMKSLSNSRMLSADSGK
jgi:hypothetical protein